MILLAEKRVTDVAAFTARVAFEPGELSFDEPTLISLRAVLVVRNGTHPSVGRIE